MSVLATAVLFAIVEGLGPDGGGSFVTRFGIGIAVGVGLAWIYRRYERKYGKGPRD